MEPIVSRSRRWCFCDDPVLGREIHQRRDHLPRQRRRNLDPHSLRSQRAYLAAPRRGWIRRFWPFR